MIWSNEEIQILKNNYLKFTDLEMCVLIPNHSESSIRTKRKQLNLLREQKSKYTFNDVILEFGKRENYVLLSTEDEFQNCLSPLRYICKKHQVNGEQRITLSHLLEGRGCKYCAQERLASSRTLDLDIEEYAKLCNKCGFTFVEAKRINGVINIGFICNKHIELGVQYMTKYNMQRNIKGCKYCAGKQLPEWYVMQQKELINPNIELLESYKNLTTRMKCYCHKHNIITNKTMQEILDGQGCKECGKEKLSSLKTLSLEAAQQKVNIQNPHIKLIEYCGHKNDVKCFCTKHQFYFTKKLNTLIYSHSGCPTCYVENIRDICGVGQEEFVKKLKAIHPELSVLGKYENNTTPIEVCCNIHNYKYSLTPTALLSRHSCCDKSRITYKEELVCKQLEDWGFRIERQKVFSDCKDKRVLPFDIYLTDFNVLIEYQGEQHYRPVYYSSEPKEQAERRHQYVVFHDELKREYCHKHSIPLIYVPFWEFENLDSYLFDQLVKYHIIKTY